jgi:nitrite reductase (NADH) large subunit
MAVSGCPRNCAEATIKDFGVICVESGYEIHIGGAAGLDVKQTELLCKVETEGEVLEYCGALLQLYREQGHYLERIHKWVARISLDSVKKQLVEDADRRRQAHERFVRSQRFAQIDPWAKRAAGRDAHEFRPLTKVGYAEVA